MTIAIRPAKIKDVPAIVALERNVANASHWSREQYETRLKCDCLLLAENNSQLLGFICARVLPGEWEIENIVVGDKFRRLGIASALVKALFGAAMKSDHPTVHLEVRESNLAARHLYMKHGFCEVGKRPNYYGDPPEDAILYTKSLST
jgi:[ribosomal protein S18]-alanine N-acetyltransferase